jgi:hypothetical protein
MLVLVSSRDVATITKSTEAQAFKVAMAVKENASTKASATMKVTIIT